MPQHICRDFSSWNILLIRLPSHPLVWRSCCIITAMSLWIMSKVSSSILHQVRQWQIWVLVNFSVKKVALFWKFLYTELEKWRSAEFYEAEVHRMQLPFSGKVAGMYASVEERQEKRVQQLRRLEEMSNRHREERLQQDQKRLHTLLTVQVSTACRVMARNKGPVVFPWVHISLFCFFCLSLSVDLCLSLCLCRSCWKRAQWSNFTDD